MQATLRRLANPPVIQIRNGFFYRHYPSSPTDKANALFPGLSLELASDAKPGESWGIIGASSEVRTDLLKVLRGEFICVPQEARSYPYLSTDQVAHKDARLRSPLRAIQYVGFDSDRGRSDLRGSYLSQRYESKRGVTDFSLWDYLSGRTELNAVHDITLEPSPTLLRTVIEDLKLQDLVDLPVSHLSNGQTRRSKIAKALLASPEILILDSPFMGLDVTTVNNLSGLLSRLAKSQQPRIILSLRSNEYIPTWLTRLIFLLDNRTVYKNALYKDMVDFLIKEQQRNLDFVGPKLTYRQAKEKSFQPDDVAEAQARLVQDTSQLLTALNPQIRKEYKMLDRLQLLRSALERHGFINGIAFRRLASYSRDGFLAIDAHIPPPDGEPLVQFEGVQLAYGDKVVLGNWTNQKQGKSSKGLEWTVRRGQRWGVFGPNGSGKTTLTALISSDHPQSFSLPIKFFGRPRLPSAGLPGISFFDIQSRIGFSSPELQAFFPRHLSIRQVLESAWADAPLSKPKFTSDSDDLLVSHILSWFQAELCPDLGPTDLFKNEMTRSQAFSLKLDPNTTRPLYKSYRPRKLYEAHQESLAMGSINTAWADDRIFANLSPVSQRVLLFLRAIVKRPDIVMLDEAFSGMDPFTLQKCHTFLAHGDGAMLKTRRFGATSIFSPPFVIRSDLDLLGLSKFPGLTNNQALIVIAHRQNEVPGCVRHWLCLPEPGEGQPRSGVFDGPVETDVNKWRTIWNLPLFCHNGMMSCALRPDSADLDDTKISKLSAPMKAILKTDVAISQALSPSIKEVSRLTKRIFKRIGSDKISKLGLASSRANVRARLLLKEIYHSNMREIREGTQWRKQGMATLAGYREYLLRETDTQRASRLGIVRRSKQKNSPWRRRYWTCEQVLQRAIKILRAMKSRIYQRKWTFVRSSLWTRMQAQVRWLLSDIESVTKQTIVIKTGLVRQAMDRQDRRRGRRIRTFTDLSDCSAGEMIQVIEREHRKIMEYISRERREFRVIKTSLTETSLANPLGLLAGKRVYQIMDYVRNLERAINGRLQRAEDMLGSFRKSNIG